MTIERIPGYGRKRPLLNIGIERLHIDSLNPRLPEAMQGKSEDEIIKVLYEEFSLEEIAISMAQNGYFDEEPLVAIPREIPEKILKEGTTIENDSYKAFIEKSSTHFIIVEGNRRLATIKILLDKNLQRVLGIRSWPELSGDVRDDISNLPVIIYPLRSEVVPYLGVRHIIGIKKWDAYAKARYTMSLLGSGLTIEDIEQRMGDEQKSIRKNAICYSMLEQAQEEFNYDIRKATENFSLLILSIGQGSVKRYLGLPRMKDISLREPVNPEKLNELKSLLSWLFGEGKDIRPVINESRDITNYLTLVVSSPEAVDYLQKTRRLEDAYELSGGEEVMLKKSLSIANAKLEKALSIAHRHKTSDIKADAKKCYETAERLFKTVNE